MSEIKGQLLGIILVLMVFGAVSVVVWQIFDSFKEKVEEQPSSLVNGSSSTSSHYRISNLTSY